MVASIAAQMARARRHGVTTYALQSTLELASAAHQASARVGFSYHSRVENGKRIGGEQHNARMRTQDYIQLVGGRIQPAAYIYINISSKIVGRTCSGIFMYS